MPFALFRVLFLAVSKTLSKLFGVATVTFFGRMPSRDDDQVAAAGLLSLWWIFLPPAIALPNYAEVVIPLLPDDDAIVRGIAIALTVIIPLAVGGLIASLHNRNDGGRWRQVLSGYGFTPLLGVLVVALVVVVPFAKASQLLRRFELRHFPIMIREGDFDDTVEEVRATLERVGISTQEQQPNPVLWRLFRTLTWAEERIFRRDLSPQMRLLVADLDDGHLEISLHATDLSIVGPQRVVAYVKAVLADELSPENLYYTWDDDAQELEDEILALRRRVDAGDAVGHDEVVALRDRLRELELDEQEWNAVRRQLYALERDCYRQAAVTARASQGRREGAGA